MTTKQLQDHTDLTSLANKLFMYTDASQWTLLQEEVFEKDIWFDMSSAGGGEAKSLPAAAICDMWKKGFEGLDAIHHQAGHYLITMQEGTADVYAYAVAYHYKKSASQGASRLFVGSYDLKAKESAAGWRLTHFIYHLKFIDGNASLT